MKTIHVAIAGALLASGCAAEKKEMTQREQIGQQWKYEKEKGSDGKEIPLAYIGSANSVRTMMAPDTFAVVLLQKMRSGETGVTVKAVGAPFTCDLSDCAIEASVDGGKPETWKGRMTDTNDGISIPPPQKAFEAIEKAQKVTVKLDLGTQGKHSFDFNTAGLDWS